MPRFDVYPMPGRGGRGYILDVQAELLDHLGTRVVVPLLPKDAAPPPIEELNPIFDIDGESYVMMTQSIATVPVRELKRMTASLDSRHDDIKRALDILLTGF
jgi:toxin CcdB